MRQKSSGAVSVVPIDVIERRIYLIRGHKVMLDRDLSELYQVATKVFNQAVKRNRDRFPPDFMFQLTKDEAEILRSQIVTSRWGGRRYLPYVFTEHGALMLSSVLKSKRAVQMGIYVVRVFVQLREYLATNKDLAGKLEEIEQTQRQHDDHIKRIYTVIEQLLEPTALPSKRHIGFLEPDPTDSNIRP